MSETIDRTRILTESGTNEVEFLEFRLGDGRYGVNVAKVNQILVFDGMSLAELPGEQQIGALGTVMFRDEPILVVDLASLIRKATPEDGSTHKRRLLLVLEFNRRVTGFVVDAVDTIRRVSWQDFKETDESNLGTRTEWITGLLSQGSEITLILDFESILSTIIPSMSPEASCDAVEPLEQARSRSLRVVYCEDSALVRKIAIKAFSKAGISDVHAFPSGKQGLEYLMANKHEKIDLIVSDIEMPEMDGLTLCKNLKQDPVLSSIPVVFFSSTINEQMKAKCVSVGGARAYSKPELDELIASFDQLLE